ncbi:MAG TPA: hypothetical protein VEY67_12260 [Candidatus Dormibacteraeota bacterium]|nr:hypothetical protein [Candidatus Dormibacteraeota bacterium]
MSDPSEAATAGSGPQDRDRQDTRGQGPSGTTGQTASPGQAVRIPAAAVSERNAQARAKGLPGLVIEGGADVAGDARRRAERRYLRLLVIMVIAIVLAGFVLGFVGLLIGGPT